MAHVCHATVPPLFTDGETEAQKGEAIGLQ